MKKCCVPIIFITIICCGCAYFFQSYKYTEDAMFIKAAAIKKLSAAVESSARYKDIPEDLKNDDLLKKATENNPRLLQGFEGFSLKAITVNKHSIVLLCDSKEEYALIEDTGCTGEVDIHHWQNNTRPPCEFTIDTSVVCGN
jgi:hypothetical protein